MLTACLDSGGRQQKPLLFFMMASRRVLVLKSFWVLLGIYLESLKEMSCLFNTEAQPQALKKKIMRGAAEEDTTTFI